MRIEATSVSNYIDQVPENRKPAFKELYETIKTNLPDGYESFLSYGMPSFCVPHEIYPNGYHVKPEEPLPFISLGNQKKKLHWSLPHGYICNSRIGAVVQKGILRARQIQIRHGEKLIRLKKMDDIPFALIARLVQKISVQQWITVYEANIKK